MKLFSHGEHPEPAVLLFQFILYRGVCGDKFSFSLILKACSRLGLIREVMQVQDLVEKSEFGSDVVLRNSLINVYLRCGCVEFGRLVFDKMPERDSMSWNAMIDGYSRIRMMGAAQGLFNRMTRWPRNAVSWNSIVRGFARSEDGIEVARGLFDEMPERDIVSWNSMIDGCVKCGRLEAAQYLFDLSTLPDFSLDLHGFSVSDELLVFSIRISIANGAVLQCLLIARSIWQIRVRRSQEISIGPGFSCQSLSVSLKCT